MASSLGAILSSVTSSATPALAPPVRVSSTPTPQEIQAAHAQKVRAYKDALARLYPTWSALPVAPYPPSSDVTNFPRTGSPELIVRKASVNAAQLAEPGKITQALNQQAIARRPKLNEFFVIGAGCLAAYLILR